ncbi:hypothetical protein Bsp3421_005034 [Burkholderia sp. FERM BP-3421]|jgi:hypothetical protein|uniref:hypothetical protein n=1 Tax=Burkholderia sp. FERM BP-3421 TaxID=1494466 RepID=UPI002361FFF5|nr:hypothetical protein [Burkholderia sp. FERM BP-3421]WDD94887.1 hypothetical protein Bsp3421_005034 [Burkholderia sp. FERM BP-3421]
MNTPSPPPESAPPKPPHRPHNRALNLLAIFAGLATFAVGAGWVIYSYIVDREAPYFAIPLVFSVPVIVAVAIRGIWD